MREQVTDGLAHIGVAELRWTTPVRQAPVVVDRRDRDAGLKSFSAEQEYFSAKQALTSGAPIGKHNPLTSQMRRPTLRPADLTVGSPFRTSVSDTVADVFKE
ncbi:hypothetical protein [Kutzneria buriramensis]|uniref:hypothetical protein n=1 Tax=Kutzneria buriramensis TaxID=1045776 RepID=UPI0011C0F2C8|nr:hypothetical protein [Kutzneria buriramensis]